MTWQTILGAVGVTVGIPVIRAIAGWLNNALEDGKIEPLEWKKLAETILRVAIPGLALYFGIDLMGIDMNIMAPLIVSSVLDWYVSIYKKATSKAVANEFKVAMVGFMRENPSAVDITKMG